MLAYFNELNTSLLFLRFSPRPFSGLILSMHPPRLVSLLLLLLPLTLTQALKFELFSQPQTHVTPRCIRNYVAADTLVVVTATVSGNKGDGQWFNIEVSPPLSPPPRNFQEVDID